MIGSQTARRSLASGALSLLGLFGCASEKPSPREEPHRLATNRLATRGYILISIDTLRADHLGCYGYRRDTSPFLDSLAARGTLFENALVQLPGTLPSHMSIFTGLYPAEHGVYPPYGVLSPEIATLPEIFQRNGFTTIGFTGGGYTAGGYGFARGFDQFSDDVDDLSADDLSTEAGITFEQGLEALAWLAADEPFFLFLHTYSVHDPYDPPEPHRSLFWHGEAPDTFEPTGANLNAVNRGTLSVTPDAVDYFEALYDAGIHYVDQVLAEFFAGLEELGLADQVTVVITSDHGEEFLDHGQLVHEQIYDENLHVPLIVLSPGLEGGRRVASLVESIDLAPTLYGLAAIPPPEGLSGRSLVAVLTGARGGVRDFAYAESADGWARTLYRSSGDGLHQLLRYQPIPMSDGLWVSRRLGFDTTAEELRFDAVSYYRPRTVAVAIEGSPLTTLELGTSWTPVRLELPAKRGRSTVDLIAATCDSPASLGRSADSRCLSFKIRGVSLDRVELYDLAVDRAATRDLAGESSELESDLINRLAEHSRQPIAAAGETELDPEHRKRLEALGYLATSNRTDRLDRR